MCNLYSNTLSQDTMRDLFEIPASSDRIGNQPPMPAIFPGHDVPVARLKPDGTRELVLMKWGFIMRPRSPKTGKLLAPKAVNNARDDKLSGAFWNASFRERRCLVPATSFCEPRGKAPATYVWFGMKGSGNARPPFAFAGIWRNFSGEWRGEEIDMATCSIVTSTPNALVRPVHPSRMAVILHGADYAAWLNSPEAEARTLIRPFPAEDMRIVQSGEDLRSDAA